MESFTEFDIHSNECLKRLKNIAKQYNEDQAQVIKCFLVFLFSKEYIHMNEYRGKLDEVNEFVKLLDFSYASSYLSQNLKMYYELIDRIRIILRDYNDIKALDDFTKTGEVIHDVFQLSKDMGHFNKKGALFDFFFNYLFAKKVDGFVSMLINQYSGKYLNIDFAQEIPLLTGQVAIDGVKGLILQERADIDFYLGMRLYIHEVVIKRNDDPEVYYVRNVDDFHFKKIDYSYSEDINAFQYFSNIAHGKKFQAFILGSARSHGWALVALSLIHI